MILKPDSEEFSELYRLLFTSVGNPDPKKFLSCVLVSGIVATWFMRKSDEVFIINGSSHSVVFDGYSTWDLTLGIVLPNYKYPNLNPPTHLKINLFYRFFNEELYNHYYCDKSLLKAQEELSYITLSHGEQNGTT